MTVAQLQALNGTLNVTIDGSLKTASVNLAAATSFSNAAEIIANDLSITGLSAGSYTGSIATTVLTVTAVINGPETAQFTGSISTTTLTVTAMARGTIHVGDVLIGAGVTANTKVSALGSGTGGIGTYTIDTSQSVASETINSYQAAGALAVGDVLSGSGGGGVTAGTYITSLGTGTGGTGTYNVSTSQTVTSSTINANAPAVVYDSQSGAFVISSGTAGASSAITFGTGAMATSLLLTAATGAVLSQGAAQSTPAAAMNAIVAISRNWAQFMTTFEPVDTDKEAFAAWTNGTGNAYGYAMVDTNVLNTENGGPAPAVAAIQLADYSGTSLIYENPAIDTVGGEIAAFVLGYGASIAFDQPQGRATADFKAQTGLTPQVTTDAVYGFVVETYGMNCYLNATTANEAFTFYDNGSVSGPFEWLDTYLDQIWLRNQMQLALMVLLTTAGSIPYNQRGYGMIALSLEGSPAQPGQPPNGPIAEAVFNGVIQPGVPLSATQIAEVNAAAGVPIDQVLATRGWYLQILPATPQVRQARGSPPINFWYMDGGSIQKITLNSITVQ
jgi:hypothetical protein